MIISFQRAARLKTKGSHRFHGFHGFVVVWIHAGRWSSGDKSPTPAAALVTSGFAVASIEYRLSGEAKFPAQIYECKRGVVFNSSLGIQVPTLKP